MMVGKHHITFGFPRGASLSDAGKLLEGTGRDLRHLKVREPRQLHDADVRQLIVESAALNRLTPLTSSMQVQKAC